MHKTRLEAFSDAVIAIIMTIMVLELRVPEGADFAALQSIMPVFLAYVMSFVYLAIYWNNHHHLLHTADHVDGRILWSNMIMLFWLSLVPFATAWMEQEHFAALPVSVYGVVLFLAGVSYHALVLGIIRHHGPHSLLASAVGQNWKGRLSLLAYLIAIWSAFMNVGISIGLYVLVTLVWFVPDRRIERKVRHEH